MYEGFAPEVTKELFALGDKLLVKHIATADEVAEAYLFAMKYVCQRLHVSESSLKSISLSFISCSDALISLGRELTLMEVINSSRFREYINTSHAVLTALHFVIKMKNRLR